MNIADSRSKFDQVEILSEGLSLLPVRCIFIIIFSNLMDFKGEPKSFSSTDNQIDKSIYKLTVTIQMLLPPLLEIFF